MVSSVSQLLIRRLIADETVDLYLALRTPLIPEQTLRSYLRRLAITVEAQIVNGHSSDRDGPPASEVIYNGEVADVESALVLYPRRDHQENEDSENREKERESDDTEQYAHVVWKVPVFLSRPRIRLQAPSVVFLASASLDAAHPRQSSLSSSTSVYMQSCVPSGLNLLDAFADDPMLGGARPHLSALRVSRVAPVTHTREPPRLLKGLQSLKLKIFPVVHSRVRFARPNTSPPSPSLLALLEVDFTPFFDCEACLDGISLSIPDGTAEDLNTAGGMVLPLSCVAHDHLTFMYSLAPIQLGVAGTNLTRDLIISIDVSVLVSPAGPEICKPRLTMAWTTNLDFTLPLNPGFGQPMTQPIQRSHRPSQLSISGGVDVQSLISPSVSRPDAVPSLEAATARPIETAIPDFGITMTFTGPDRPVYAGEEFSWSIFVVNRSKRNPGPDGRPDSSSSAAGAPTQTARKLALFAIPKRRRNELRVARPPSIVGVPGSKRDPLIADAVLDENVVHAMQRNNLVDNTDVVCLSADVRVGPLAPNACAVVELRFLALRAGIVGIEAVRIVDLATQEHVDVRELPVMMIAENKEGSEQLSTGVVGLDIANSLVSAQAA